MTYSELVTIGVAVHARYDTATSEADVEQFYENEPLLREQMKRHTHEFHRHMNMSGIIICHSIEKARAILA